jgi:predicted histidine transporter YuiF (NhaC family)
MSNLKPFQSLRRTFSRGKGSSPVGRCLLVAILLNPCLISYSLESDTETVVPDVSQDDLHNSKTKWKSAIEVTEVVLKVVAESGDLIPQPLAFVPLVAKILLMCLEQYKVRNRRISG